MPVTEKKREMPEKLLYSRKEAAYALSVSVKSIDRMIADKQLGRRILGRRILVPASDVRRAARQDHFLPTKPSNASVELVKSDG